MSVNTVSGTKFYIGGVATDATDTASEYAALTWTEVKELETIPTFGDQSTDVTYTAVGDQRTRHLKGTRDAGSDTWTFGWDPLDAGQSALKAAEKTKFTYAFKLEAADALDANDTNSIFYFQAKVMSARRANGNGNSVVMLNAVLGITTEVLEVPATVVA